METIKKVYLAGPMRGKPQANKENFVRVTKALRDQLIEVISPIELDEEKGIDHETISDDAMDAIAPRCITNAYNVIKECDAIVVLPGWSESEGTLNEMVYARSLNKPIYDANSFARNEHQLIIDEVFDLLSTIFDNGQSFYATTEELKTISEQIWNDFYNKEETDEEKTDEEETDKENQWNPVTYTYSDLVVSDDKLRLFSTGSVRSSDADKVAFHLISPHAMERLAETYREGEKKYSAYNWEKGQPVGEVLNHVIRHIYKYLDGDRTEDHMAHAAWGLFAVMHFEKNNPEMFEGLREVKD